MITVDKDRLTFEDPRGDTAEVNLELLVSNGDHTPLLLWALFYQGEATRQLIQRQTAAAIANTAALGEVRTLLTAVLGAQQAGAGAAANPQMDQLLSMMERALAGVNGGAKP